MDMFHRKDPWSVHEPSVYLNLLFIISKIPVFLVCHLTLMSVTPLRSQTSPVRTSNKHTTHLTSRLTRTRASATICMTCTRPHPYNKDRGPESEVSSASNLCAHLDNELFSNSPARFQLLSGPWPQLSPVHPSRGIWVCKASLSGSFTRVSFAFNSLPHMHFWWYVNVLMKREKNWVSWRWNSLGTVTNSLWVIELNVYETMEWNFPLRVGVLSEFHFILYDMAVLETTKWNFPLRLA
jgi:hypothetical protein